VLTDTIRLIKYINMNTQRDDFIHKADELNNFPRTPDRHRWKEMELWVNKTTPTTKSGAT